RRVEAAVESLTAPHGTRAEVGAVADLPHAVVEPALAHLHSLERALIDLAHPLQRSGRTPLLGA
ncbi:FUSC family protein, partial [Streptomyces sp. SID10116]|nr:FUSC family protein [Streptomyces sp. SID10116]